MKIKVLFDKRAIHSNLNTGWGISLLVGENTLFDTGEKGEWLIENMRKLNVDPGTIKNIVISHDHWDHTGGLWELLRLTKNVNLYICPGFSREFKSRVKNYKVNLIESSQFTFISEGIAITGEMEGNYKGSPIPEQSLIIRETDRISVITGCSHPGIINILHRIRSQFGNKSFHFVMGGFHLLNEEKIKIHEILFELTNLNVQYLGATHCTGENAEMLLREKYKNNFIEVKVGKTFDTQKPGLEF